MTPRPDIDWLDIHEGLEGVQKHLAVAKHPRLLFCDGRCVRTSSDLTTPSTASER